MYDILFLLTSLGLSLGLTLLIELSVAFAARVRGLDLLLVLLVNLLTNPVVVYLSLVGEHLLRLPPLLIQIPLELLVVPAEGICYARLAKHIRHPWLLAVVANLLSYGCGIALNLILS